MHGSHSTERVSGHRHQRYARHGSKRSHRRDSKSRHSHREVSRHTEKKTYHPRPSHSSHPVQLRERRSSKGQEYSRAAKRRLPSPERSESPPPQKKGKYDTTGSPLIGSVTSTSTPTTKRVSPFHTLVMDQGQEAFNKSWFALLDSRYGPKPSKTLKREDCNKQLEILKKLAEEDPYEAKQRLDQLMLKVSDSSFSIEQKEAVHDIEGRCFSKLNSGKELWEVVLETENLIKSNRGKINEDARKKIIEKVEVLAGWQLHFRYDTKNLISGSYYKDIMRTYNKFSDFISYLFESLVQENKSEVECSQEVEKELHNLFDSFFNINAHGSDRLRIRSLVAIVADRLHNIKHPFRAEINRAKKSSPEDALAICAKLTQYSSWLKYIDLIKISLVRFNIARSIKRYDLIAQYAKEIPLEIDNIELLEVRYSGLIEGNSIEEARATIDQVKRLADNTSSSFHDALKAEICIIQKKAKLDWNPDQGLPERWKSMEPSSWDRHISYMKMLSNFSNPTAAKRKNLHKFKASMISYLITHISEPDLERFIRGQIFESENQRAIYNSRLMAVRCNKDDRDLCLWTGGKELEHPANRLVAKFIGSPLKKNIEIFSLQGLAHDSKRYSGGLQNIRDLLRWYPKCQWNFCFTKANYFNLKATIDGQVEYKQTQPIDNLKRLSPQNWDLMMKNPSLQQVDMLELNLYPNMIYYRLCEIEHRQEERQDINQDFIRYQLEICLKKSYERIQKNLLPTDSKKITDEERYRLQMLLVDHLECCCSIHLSKIKGDKNELNKEALSVSKNFPKNMIKVMNKVINDFNDYLINKRHNHNIALSPGQIEFKQLMSYVTGKSGR